MCTVLRGRGDSISNVQGLQTRNPSRVTDGGQYGWHKGQMHSTKEKIEKCSGPLLGCAARRCAALLRSAPCPLLPLGQTSFWFLGWPGDGLVKGLWAGSRAVGEAPNGEARESVLKLPSVVGICTLVARKETAEVSTKVAAGGL